MQNLTLQNKKRNYILGIPALLMSLYLIISGAKPFIAFVSGDDTALLDTFDKVSGLNAYFIDFLENGYQMPYEFSIKAWFFIPAIILLLIAILSFVIPNRKARVITSIVLTIITIIATIIATIIIFISAKELTYWGDSLSNMYTFTCLGMIILSLVGINMFSTN